MLCADEVVNLDIDCPVDIEAGEYACVKISNVRLDITKIQGEFIYYIKSFAHLGHLSNEISLYLYYVQSW